ncbi:argininosuccinate lyase [Spirosomataceae bacterium TFI 002]|nr:argininosuccinate lyase [Spirosomataceae bacterium TFI 002]
MKLWQKGNSDQTLKNIETFTIGKDQLMDIHLAKFDLLGNIAHAIMLESVGLLEKHELIKLLRVCKDINQNEISKGKFKIEDGVEDVHSQIEYKLTKELGDIGKKIHSGRSRNDQVLVDLKMYLRDELTQITNLIVSLSKCFIAKSNSHKNDYLPGYTHLQIAMPSSFGLWFGAYAESLIDDLSVLAGVYKVVNKNPLGSGAGYGSSFNLDRKLTTELLGFDQMDYNVVYAQMSRGKSEYLVSMAISSIAQSLSKFAMDVCLYSSQNFAFIELPTALTTGSSIMPHKKNPDVAEILRGKFNLLKALPTQISSLTSNLPSGYHREFQLLKELIIPAIIDFKDALQLCEFMIEHIKVNKDLLEDPKYDLLFSVENVNDLVNNGTTFRDAYRIVGEGINDGKFIPKRDLNHTLEGSIGNLDNSVLENRMDLILNELNFGKVEQAYENLLNYEVK